MSISLAIALKEAHDADLTPQELIKVLLSIMMGIEPMDVVSMRSLSAGYIHALFTKQDMYVHSLLLQIICELEASVPTTTSKDSPSSNLTFLEKHLLDRLVVQSLESRHPDPQPRIDDEKDSAFRVVSLMLKVRGRLPASIVRSLVSLYNTPKHCYKDLILSYLCRAALCCPSIVASVPEVGQIIVDRLAETGAKELSSLLCYSAEAGAEFVHQKDFISHLLFPLTKMVRGEEEVLTNCVTAVSDVLSTWPGLIFYGFQNGVLRDLVRLMRHRASSVIRIFMNILRINEKKSVLDGYLGLLMNGLKKLDFVEELHIAAKGNVDAAVFLNHLMPYLTCVASTVDIVPTAMKVTDSSETCQSISMAHMIHPSGMRDEETKVTSVRDLKGDLNFDRDWQKIHRIITVVLPHNEDELSSKEGRQFCLKVLNSFQTPVKDEANKKVAAHCLYSLVDLMLRKGKKDVLLEAGTFIDCIKQTLAHLIANKEEQHCDTEINWVLLKALFIISKDPQGADLLEKWKLKDGLQQVGGVCKSAETAKKILDAFRMSSSGGITSQFLLAFLSNTNPDIFARAIEKIGSMVNRVEGFEKAVFKDVVLKHIGLLLAGEKTAILAKQRSTLVKLLYELMLNNDTCLTYAAENRDVHQFLGSTELCSRSRSQKDHGRIVYSLLFSKEKGCEIGNVDEEITWWLKEGNFLYVDVYDAAMAGESGPAIIGKPPVVPPHLFGQLAKTELGRKKIFENIPRLLEIASESRGTKRRAAIFAICHFASEKSTHAELEKQDLFEYVVKDWQESSYVLKGAIISALSLVAKSKHFTKFLVKKEWQLYEFGSHCAAVPCDITKDPPQSRPLYCQTIEEVEAMEEQTLLIRQMASPIAVRSARDQLASMYQESRDELVCKDLAVYAHEYMAKFSLPPDSRAFLMKLFNSIPLVYIDLGEIDQRECAEVRARISELRKKTGAEDLQTVKIPKYTREQLATKDICQSCPEVYLDPAEFQSIAGMSLEDFYSQDDMKMDEIRSSLLVH